MSKGKGKKKTKKPAAGKKPDESPTDAATESESTEDENIRTSETSPEEDPATLNTELDPPVPAPIPESSPKPQLPKIALRVFEKLAGPKWDQLAGFKLYAKKNRLGPMTVPEWREALQAFRDKPTKSR